MAKKRVFLQGTVHLKTANLIKVYKQALIAQLVERKILVEESLVQFLAEAVMKLFQKNLRQFYF